MDWVQIVVAGGTAVLAVVTAALAYFTWRLANGQIAVAKEQLQVQLYLELRREFDGDRMILARRKLADELLSNPSNRELPQEVMNFFEDLGMLYRRGFLDRQMVWDSFGYYARLWWSSCKDWISDTQSGDATSFDAFGFLIEEISKDEALKLKKTRSALEPSSGDIQAFLQDESSQRQV